MTNPNQPPPQSSEPQELLTGPRQTGIVPGPNGSAELHYVDADGAKIVRQTGEPYKSAADFHAQKMAFADHYEDTVGVRPAGFPPRRSEEVPAEKAPEPEMTQRSPQALKRAGRVLRRLISKATK